MSRRKSLGPGGCVFCFSAAFDGKDMPPFTWIVPRVASCDRRWVRSNLAVRRAAVVEYPFTATVGMARCAVPARVVTGGTNIQATLGFERVARLHAAQTSQRD